MTCGPSQGLQDGLVLAAVIRGGGRAVHDRYLPPYFYPAGGFRLIEIVGVNSVFRNRQRRIIGMLVAFSCGFTVLRASQFSCLGIAVTCGDADVIWFGELRSCFCFLPVGRKAAWRSAGV